MFGISERANVMPPARGRRRFSALAGISPDAAESAACLQREQCTLRLRVLLNESKAGSPSSLLWFRLLHRGLLGAFLCAAASLENPLKARPLLHPRYGGVSLAHERPRRSVIGHVLLHGDARNGAADYVESQVVQ